MGGDVDGSATGPRNAFGLTTLEVAERQLIAAALRAYDGNQSRVARALAIERHRLRRRIVHHGLQKLARPPR
jgi:DNA-binding NtrC family response regulator